MLRKGETYEVVVIRQREDVWLSAQIKGTLKNGTFIELSDATEEHNSNGSIVTLVFDTQNLTDGAYVLWLKFTAASGVQEVTKPLTFFNNDFIVFIVTDKPLYYESEVVTFQLFAVDYELLPFNATNITTISIYDPANTQLRRYQNFNFVNGKYQNTFQLSIDALIGYYGIKVNVSGKVFESSIRVVEKPKPKCLDLRIDVPPVVVLDDGK